MPRHVGQNTSRAERVRLFKPSPEVAARMAATPLSGIGERLGQSADAVIRRPAPAVVPLLVDAAAFVVGVLVLLALGFRAGDPSAYRGATFGFAVAGALPSLADALDVGAAARALGQQGVLAVSLLALAFLPLVAFVEGGFVALLAAVYVEKDERTLGELVREVFLPAAKARFLPMLLYRGALAAAFLSAGLLGLFGGPLRAGATGALALRFLLVFAPYAIVLEGASFADGVRASLVAIGDHLASCLVTLLFLLLVTGGAAALVTPFLHAWGPGAALLAILLYAPVGTALSLFLLLVWRSLSRYEPAPESAPAGAPAEA